MRACKTYSFRFSSMSLLLLSPGMEALTTKKKRTTTTPNSTFPGESSPPPKFSYMLGIILPLSHKSGALCLYEPLPVSDALGDDFF